VLISIVGVLIVGGIILLIVLILRKKQKNEKKRMNEHQLNENNSKSQTLESTNRTSSTKDLKDNEILIKKFATQEKVETNYKPIRVNSQTQPLKGSSTHSPIELANKHQIPFQDITIEKEEVMVECVWVVGMELLLH
jgi:hypothetical protein